MAEHWRRPHWGGPHSPPGPGAGMFRKIGLALVAMAVVSVGLGATIATGIAALSGGGRLAVVGATVLVVFLVAGRFRRRVGRTWQPIGQLIDATDRLGRGEADVRIRSAGRGPMGAVTASFNRMAERLEDEDRRRRRLLSDLGHELRTPLTVLRGEVEAVRDGVRPPRRDAFESMLADVAMLERLAEDLRTMALTESGALQLRPEPTDLGQLVAEVTDSFATAAAARDVGLEVTAGAATPVMADPMRIRQVLSNLLDNALRHAPPNSTVTVRHLSLPDRVQISVEDRGPGFETDQLAAVFDRFVKAADSSGSGLGLSIARDLVEAHGGSIEATNRSDGPGAVLRFTLPLRSPLV